MTTPLRSETVAISMDNREDEWIAILRQFIQIPSENPPGDTTEVASYLTGLLDEREVPYEVIAPKEDLPNIVAHFEGESGDPDSGNHLVYNGHIDTLHVGEKEQWDRDPFSGDVENGNVYGRGATDMYGGLTASLAAFLYLFENRDQVHGKATFTAVSDEETGGTWGAKYLVDNYPEYHGDAVISGEPSGNNIIRFAERGTAWTRIKVYGEPAVSSYGKGRNSIETLCQLLLDVKELAGSNDIGQYPEDVAKIVQAAKEPYDETWGEGATEKVQQIDVSTGVINGGKDGAVNVVPESATAQVDIRLPVGTSGNDVKARIQELASEYDETVEVEIFQGTDPTVSDIDHPIFQSLQRNAGLVRDGDKPDFSCALAGTDCRYWRQYDIPAAVYGPTPRNVGGRNEYIKIKDFMEIVKTQAMASAEYLSMS